MFRPIKRASALLANLSKAVVASLLFFAAAQLLGTNAQAQEPATSQHTLEAGDHIWGTCIEALPTVASLAAIDTCKDTVLKQLGISERQARKLPIGTTFTITLTSAQLRDRTNEPLFQHQEQAAPGAQSSVQGPAAPAANEPVQQEAKDAATPVRQNAFDGLRTPFDVFSESDMRILILASLFCMLVAILALFLFFKRQRSGNAAVQKREEERSAIIVIAEEHAKDATLAQRTIPIIVHKKDDGSGSYSLRTRIEGLPQTLKGYNPRAVREEIRSNLRTINRDRGMKVVFGPQSRTETLYEGGGKLPRLDELFTTERPIYTAP